MLARSPHILEDPHDTRWRRLRTKAPSLIAVGALHAVAIVALLQYAPVREALSSAAPIMVSLITPKLEVEEPQVEPPKPVEEAAPAVSAAPSRPGATLPFPQQRRASTRCRSAR